MTPLRLRMTEDMQVRNLSPRTQSTYLMQVSLFARHFGQSPALLGPEQIRNYQLFLTNRKKMSPSSIKVAVAALRFLYQVTLKRGWDIEQSIPSPKRPRKLPVVASPEEVLRFLDCAPGLKHRAILTACYAAGLARVGSGQPATRPTSTAGAGSFASNRARAARIATSCSRPGCWLSCAITGERSVPPPGSGSSRGSHPYTPFPPRRWCAPATKPSACPICPNSSRPTRCDTVLPFTCSKPAPTSAPSNSCSAIATSPPPPATLHLASSKVSTTTSPLDLLPLPQSAESTR